MTSIVGQPFRCEPLPPEVFLRSMIDAGAEMACMGCVYDHWKRYAAGTIPGADDTFDDFPQICGRPPVAAFAVYELVLLAATLILPSGSGAFTLAVVLRIFAINAAAAGLLFGAHGLASLGGWQTSSERVRLSRVAT